MLKSEEFLNLSRENLDNDVDFVKKDGLDSVSFHINFNGLELQNGNENE